MYIYHIISLTAHYIQTITPLSHFMNLTVLVNHPLRNGTPGIYCDLSSLPTQKSWKETDPCPRTSAGLGDSYDGWMLMCRYRHGYITGEKNIL